MLLDLWPWIFPFDEGGDDGGWRGKRFKKQKYPEKTLRKAIQTAIDVRDTRLIPASIVADVKGQITAPKMDWDKLKSDLELSHKIVQKAKRWQDERDIEAILVLI